jgi:tetratricopeptide (TPR) repeat protein
MLRPQSMRLSPFPALTAVLLGMVTVAEPVGAQTAPTGGPSSASAEAAPAPPPASGSGQARALVHYERSRAYYAAGRYRASIAELEAAVRLDPNGYNLYFDLGLVYERIGRLPEALGAYRRYLAHVQDPVERERAERIIARLQGARSELADLYPVRGNADTLFWSGTLGSVATLVAGGALLASALRADETTEALRHDNAPAWRVREAMDSAQGQHLAADVTLLGGGALAVTAVLLYLLRETPAPNAPLCLSANGAGLRLRF